MIAESLELQLIKQKKHTFYMLLSFK